MRPAAIAGAGRNRNTRGENPAPIRELKQETEQWADFPAKWQS